LTSRRSSIGSALIEDGKMFQQTKAWVFALLVKTTKPISNIGLTRIPGAAQLRDWVLRSLTPAGRILVTFPRFQMYLNPRDTGLSRELIAGEAYESFEADLFLGLLTPGMVIIDVGANVGYYGMLAASCTGDGVTVYAFEPEQATYAYLAANVELNQLTGVIPINSALSNVEGPLTFYSNASNLGKHSILPEAADESIAVEVPCTTLDTFVRSNHVDRLDVLKLDVEGAEGLVIDGGWSAIERFRPIVFLEFTPEWLRKTGTAPEALLRRFIAIGYTIGLIDAQGHEVVEVDLPRLAEIERGSRWTFQANLILRAG
jgi:FkbM family methyltransferase